jgi:tetratricopeptide (TPR) repeat protein
MFNALEVKTLKARYCQALSAIAAGVVVSLPLAATAQAPRVAPDPNAPRLMVGVFRSSDKTQGVQAADAIRSRVASDAGGKQLYVLPKNDIDNTLQASGFPTTEALAPHDARALAQLLRADEYIVGNIVKDSAGLRVDANLVLTRDNSLVQPLGSYRVDKADKAASAISKDFRDAQKAYDDERACYIAAREQKFDVALAAARKGIAEYPKSTLARLCMANVMQSQKAAPAEVLKVAQEVIQIDPRSKPALQIAYDAYKTAGDTAKADETLLALISADPGNQRLLEQVANEWAAGGKAAKAVPVVEQLVRENPGDPSYLTLQMRVKLAAKDYKGGIAAGEELIKSDTAAATADLFTRLATAAVLDSQPQKAAQIAAQGVQKFPANGDLLGTYADALTRSGQSQQAMEVMQKALQANPKLPGAYAALARMQAEAGQDDAAFQSLQQAVAGGDSASTVARYALSIGQTAYRAANAAKTQPAYEKAIKYLEFSDKTSPSDEAKFLLGVTSLGFGQMQLQEAQKSKGCTQAKGAQTAFLTAQTNLPAGGKFNPQATQQALSGLTQLSPYADQMVKAFCK